jgi:hypothetical protein
MIARRTDPAAGEQRLVVAGDHPGIAAIRGRHQVGAKMTLEEGADRRLVRGVDRNRIGARRLPDGTGGR